MNMNMTPGERESLRSLFVRATDLAMTSLKDISEAMGRVRRTLQMYRAGQRRVTPDAARALALYLREQARAFEGIADELERTADKEEADE